MKHLVPALGWALGLAVATTLAQTPAQEPQQPSATFRSAVDLVPVDVNVIDRSGRPVADLEVDDFALMVDGKPRKIASAQYIPAVRDVEDPGPTPTHYSSNAKSAGGRLIMLVVDQGNIGVGRGRLAMEAATRFIDRLTPADRIGLVAIPGAGPQLDFTANHALVKTMLRRIVGQATSSQGPYRIGISEATRLARGDDLTRREVLDRECAGFREPAEIELCTRQFESEAASVFATLRERTRNSLTALRYLVERLSLNPSPKTIIFLSEGLVIDRDFAELSWLGPAAARGQIVLYVMQLDQPMFDASSSRVSPTRSEDVALGEEGLGLLAGLARGTVMRIISSGDSVFGRLALELSGYYLLSFEPEPGDRDGKSHKIKVQVPGRERIEVRARAEFTIGAARSRTDEENLADALRAPLLSSDIRIDLSTYTLREPQTGKLRILVAAEIDRSLNPSSRLSLAYMLLDANGSIVSSQIQSEIKEPIRAATRTQHFVGSMLANAPGVHTLKLAVVDDTGKRGSVEHSFNARLATAGQVRATDLLIAENTGVGSGGVRPAVSGDFASDMLHGYLELYSDSPEALKNATVMIEVAEGEDGRALDGTAARFQSPAPETPNRRTAEAAVPIALLPPGEYVARAVINISGRRAGQVTRPFRITRAAPVVTAPGEGLTSGGAMRAPIPFTSRIDNFERASVLTPEVVGFFLDRMNVGSRGESAGLPAIEHARKGRFDEALAALSSAGNEKVTPVFLNGLALYAKGDLEGAAGKFRETLRIDSEFFPAAFYLGSCYAAGGRDREAAGAWQTSLVTESDAPFIYTLLGDALLRLRDVDQALDILTEAATLWPENDQVTLRLGTALVMGGKPAEAIQVLDPYLARNPGDHERHFLALRALYESRAAGTSIKSPDEDRALFTRYSAAYEAAKGPQQALVDQWRKFVDKKP